MHEYTSRKKDIYRKNLYRGQSCKNGVSRIHSKIKLFKKLCKNLICSRNFLNFNFFRKFIFSLFGILANEYLGAQKIDEPKPKKDKRKTEIATESLFDRHHFRFVVMKEIKNKSPKISKFCQ